MFWLGLEIGMMLGCVITIILMCLVVGGTKD